MSADPPIDENSMPQLETINPGWPRYERYTFSPAVRKGNLLFISGLTATDEEGAIVGEGDIVAQTRRIFELIGEILAEAGGGFDDIVKTVDFITTSDNYAGTAAVRREFFPHGFPAATGVIVKQLLRPGALIEIDAIAVLDDA
jgi:enamine deaminase RidA (YjgF/YER057c/UK114 family)